MNRYENYLETGFEWIGKIPSSWELSRVGKFFTERSEKVDDVSYPPLSVTMNGIVDQLSDVAKSNDNDNRKLVKKDDFVINSRSDRKGSSGIAPRDGSVSLINIVLAPKNIDPKYIENLFKSYYFKEEYFRNGKGIHWDLWTTRWEQFKNINIPIPPIEEQKLISCYLDKKTSQIDSLVEKIQKKIELLKEQRTSLINHYVTKGLDSNVEMKDSGVEWIGEIPKHWEVTKYKYEITIQNGYPLKSELFDNDVGFPIIRIRDVTSGQIETYYTGEIVETHVVRNGDLLIGMDGDFNIRWWTGPESLLNQRVCRIFEGDHYNRRYLYYLLPYQLKVINELTYYTTVKHLSSFDILGTLTILPPLSEQEAISKYLDGITSKLDILVEKHQFKILKLKEYRQSLISSVVTGKVRVTEDMI